MMLPNQALNQARNEVQIYCLKCKTYTNSEDVKEEVITVRNKPRRILKAICSVCKKKKSRFLSS